MVNRVGLSAALVLLVLLVVGAGPLLGKGRTQKVSDERSSGTLYDDKSIYANCDIDKLAAKKARSSLQVKVFVRGNQKAFVNTGLNLNTRGSKRSDPEYWVRGAEGTLTKTGGIGDFGQPLKPKQVGNAKVLVKSGGKLIQFQVPIKKLGKPRKTGVQAQTCGEGAVDIAPGGNYFDDTGFDGSVANKYANVKTR
jgi:hypothetical protein